MSLSVAMNEAQSMYCPRGTGSELVTTDLTGCQATILYSQNDISRTAALTHIAPHVQINDREVLSNSIQRILEQHPQLRDPQNVVIYYSDSKSEPKNPTIEGLADLGIRVDSSSVKTWPYAATSRDPKRVALVMNCHPFIDTVAKLYAPRRSLDIKTYRL